MSEKYQIPVLGKTFKIIEKISDNPDGITFTELVTLSEEPKATVFRILQTLEKNNWIEKNGDSYSLGFMFIHYGLQTLAKRDLRSRALPHMQKVTSQLEESSHLAVLSGTKSMILEVCESPQHIKPSSTIGSLLPLYCTSHGKVLLAFAEKNTRQIFLQNQQFEQKTSHTITTPEQLKKELETIRKQKYAVDNLEYMENVRCLAAPVFGQGDICIGAIGITATAYSFPEEKIEEYALVMCTAAEALSREMGATVDFSTDASVGNTSANLNMNKFS